MRTLVSLLKHAMPLALTDPRWSELKSSYNGTEDVVTWLTEAYQHGLAEESLGDLINEVQHQGVHSDVRSRPAHD